MHELYVLNKKVKMNKNNLYILILLKSKSYILIHHTFTRSACYTRYCWEVWVRTLLLTFVFYRNLPHYI